MTQLTGTTRTADAVRSRTVEWLDPTATAGVARSQSGLEFLRAGRGELGGSAGPSRVPIAALLGFDLEEVDEGRVVFAMDPGEHLYNPIGSVHGGAYATILDSAMGCAVHSTLPHGTAYTSLDLSVRFLRAITVGTGRVRCEGTVVHRGSKVATAEGRLTDGRGRLLATGSSTCLLLPAPTATA